MKNTAILALAFSAGLVLLSVDEPATPPPGLASGQEIFHAVLEGLYEDGISNKTCDLVLRVEDGAYAHFVPGCPVCIYVLEAFRHYRRRPDFVSFKLVSNTWGEGLPKEVRARFASDESKTRLEALHDLVERWLERRMDRLRLTERERIKWRDHLRERAKKGTAMLMHEREAGRMLQWGDSGCPSCDGAVDGATGG